MSETRPRPADGTIERFGLDAFFSPASVAVYGASSDPKKIGGRPIDYMKRLGFSGNLYPINIHQSEVQGIKAYASAGAIPNGIDLGIIAVPAHSVLAAAEDCIAAGARNLIVYSLGFAETGAAGAERQRQLVELAKRHDARILGPNCMGAFNAANRFIGTFTSTLEYTTPLPGRIGIISQSGAIGSHLFVLASQRGLGIAKWVSTGNEADVSVSELVHSFAHDSDVDVILLYVEGTRDGRALYEALRLANERGKAVIVLKVGRSEAGAAAASTHTAALVGSDAVFEAMLQQSGAIRADTISDAIQLAYAFGVGPRAAGNRLGIMSISGGAGVILADAAAEKGLDVPALPERARIQLQELIPDSTIANPVDTTGMIFSNPALLWKSLEILLDAGEMNAIVAFFSSIGIGTSMFNAARDNLIELRKRYPDKPIAFSILCDDKTRRELRESGILVFDEPTDAITALAALAKNAPAPRISARPGIPNTGLSALPANEVEAYALLDRIGIATPKHRFVPLGRSIADAFDALDGAAVLKIVSPHIQHKSDVGGVRLGLTSAADAEGAAEDMLARVHGLAPGSIVEGFLLAEMLPSNGVEAIVGISRDPAFGPIVAVGIGGVFAEVFQDVAMRLAPVDEATAREMIAQTRLERLLSGFRGAPRCDADALAKVVSRISHLAWSEQEAIASIDLNPVFVLPEGAIAADAVFEAPARGLP